MKKGIKKLVGAYVAVVATAALAVTAFAADYAVIPGFSTEASQPTAITTEEVSEAVSNASKSEAAVIEVKSVANFALQPSILRTLDKSSGAVLTIASPKVTLSIDSAKITKARKVDLSLKVSNTSNKTIIKMKSKKDFGCEVKIAVTSCKMSAEKFKTAHIYCDGEDLGPIEEFDENGFPVIAVTKGGTYTIK